MKRKSFKLPEPAWHGNDMKGLDDMRCLDKEREHYPEPIRWMQEALKTSKCIGIYDVNCPSMHMGPRYVAISGDGLFLFALKIIGDVTDGVFEIVQNRITRHITQDEKRFLKLMAKSYGDTVTTDEVILAWSDMYECRRIERGQVS